MNKTACAQMELQRQVVREIRAEQADAIVRMISGLLAAGGLLWAILLSMRFDWSGNPARVVMFLLITAPGFLMTTGYVARAFAHVDMATRKWLWIASLVVQNGSALLGLPGGFAILSQCWWGFSVLASARALQLERRIFDRPKKPKV